MTPEQPDGRDQEGSARTEAPVIETAEGHTGSDHVSHGANTNLTPAEALTEADARAAETVEEQHQGSST